MKIWNLVAILAISCLLPILAQKPGNDTDMTGVKCQKAGGYCVDENDTQKCMVPLKEEHDCPKGEQCCKTGVTKLPLKKVSKKNCKPDGKCTDVGGQCISSKEKCKNKKISSLCSQSGCTCCLGSVNNLIADLESLIRSTNTALDNKLNEMYEEVQQVKSSIEECSTKDQIITLQELITADECAEGSHNCSASATCNDAIGHYKCVCMQGYSGDGHTCQDINECESGIHQCHQFAICTNTIGGYTCKCLPYYDGDGYTCNVPDCISPSQVISGLGCVTGECAGTWDEAQTVCHGIGGRLIEGLRKWHLSLLRTLFWKGADPWFVWVGCRGGQWVDSGEPVQDDLWFDGEPNGSGNDNCAKVKLHLSALYMFDTPCSSGMCFLCQRIY